MKMNNVSFATRAMNQNLRNQKTAPKNPSFGFRIVIDKSAKISIENHSVAEQTTLYDQILRQNQEQIKAGDNEPYKGYIVKINSNDLNISREDFKNENKYVSDKYSDILIAIIKGRVDISSELKGAFDFFNVIKNSTSREMKQQLEENIIKAKKANVPNDVIKAYNESCSRNIENVKAYERDKKYLKDNKEKIEALYV